MIKDYYFVGKCKCGVRGPVWRGCPEEDEVEPCDMCDSLPNLTEIHKVADPQKVLCAAEAELEDANYHSIASLPTSLYSAVLPLVPEDRRLELAWAIANAMPA